MILAWTRFICVANPQQQMSLLHLPKRHDVRWRCIEALDNRNRKLSVWSTHTLKKCKTSERDTNGEKKPGCKKIYYLCEREKGRADPPGSGRGERKARGISEGGGKKRPRRECVEVLWLCFFVDFAWSLAPQSV